MKRGLGYVAQVQPWYEAAHLRLVRTVFLTERHV